jgi:malate dehydrogenase (oxaloacetate-decarboxylating)(NADP+)
MSENRRKLDALEYHEQGRPGKIEVIPTKPTSSQRDLSLAYSPGVAEPCLAIAENSSNVYRYTTKGNLVAVISNGTAVLGLGDIGPEAAKPVMEGKGLLFKIFADIDVFDIEVDATDVDTFVNTVKSIAPTFGGINLEDIKAPECFEIERRLKEVLDIPLMHDDQHGTAIISAAALLNALDIAGKKIEDVRIVVNGAGAAAISCSKMYLKLGAKLQNIVMFDSKGLITKNRQDIDEYKRYFATDLNYPSLAEAMVGADIFLGLSKGNIVSKEMLKTMADNPIVFALANPDPEISYTDAVEARPDVIMATGRSDYPNQVNNVLGFPFIFRGALDVRAKRINEEMKVAAAKAIAQLAKEPIPETVLLAYNKRDMHFGREYIIPKPLDPRLLTTVAPAVAEAAIKTGVAQKNITDWEEYKNELEKRLGRDNKLIRKITTKAKSDPKRVVFAEADHYKILKAAQIVKDENIAIPILLGDPAHIKRMIDEYKLDLSGIEIIDPRSKEEEQRLLHFADLFFDKRKRRGFTLFEARKIMRERNYFGSMLVEQGYADAMISGLTRKYPDTIRPALQIIGTAPGVNAVAGMYIMINKKGTFFFADTTVNINPTTQQLVDITLLTVEAVRKLTFEPRVALLSYTNFGSVDSDDTVKIQKAVEILHQNYPDIVVDGEIQANFALNSAMVNEQFPFSPLGQKPANVLIFPNLAAGNIAYKMLQEIGETEAIGPILLGLNKPVHVLQLGTSVREIVNMVTIAVVDAQSRISQKNN